MPNVEEVFEELKREGWKTALISSGLPTFVVRDLASKLKVDYAFGFNLETRYGIVTGEISGEVIEHQGKLLVLKRILEAEEMITEKLVVVADDRNNAPILLPEALKIGYNPDFLVRVKADHVVTGSLVEVLPLIGVEKPRKEISLSKSTVFREAIHACGFTVPFLSSLVGNYAVALLIIAVTFLYAASEVAMMEGKRVPIISWIVHNAATKAELHEFATAPVFFALGILFTLLLFPISVSNAAIATFALGDSAAAIVGKTFGRKRLSFNKGKTLEGLAAGLFAGFLVALVYVNPLKALAAAATATIVESLPLPINDNLTIPLTTALVLTLIA
jgi:dolichol kinase